MLRPGGTGTLHKGADLQEECDEPTTNGSSALRTGIRLPEVVPRSPRAHDGPGYGAKGKGNGGPAHVRSQSQLLLTKRLSKAPMPDVQDKISWYHPKLSRHISESLLMASGMPDGSYLLRDSSCSESLTVSVKCRNSVKHFRVLWDGRHFVFGLEKFRDIEGFLDHFQNQPVICGESGVLVTLKNPYPRDVHEPQVYERTSVHMLTPASLLAPPPQPSLSINSKEGFLTKLGYHRKNWKKRWFVLVRNELKYFNTHKDPAPLRVIDLSDASAAERDTSMERSFCFRLITSYRTFFMCATSDSELTEWVDLLSWKLSHNAVR